jgi:hypothetical protein
MLIEKFKLPLNDTLLKNHNFFEMYPFDGGGNFINSNIMKTVDDKEYAERLQNGALDEFGGLDSLEFQKFERWRTIEQSCWLNRCYFLVPLAKEYWQTKDENVAEKAKNVMLRFIQTQPAPQSDKEIGEHWDYVQYIRKHNYNEATFEQIQQDETDVKYVWFDFQPASRIIHFLYAMHFLQNSPTVSAEEWSILEDAIDQHAYTIAIGERDYCELHSPGNHQSVRGLALMFAAAFLGSEHENYQLYLNEALRICNYHIKEDFYSDGVLKEISPSYHMFETWHVRDAWLLSQTYGFAIAPEAKEILSNAAAFINGIRQPDGRSTVLNDGYALNLNSYLPSFPQEILSSDTECSKRYYPEAGIAVYKDANYYICFDASKYTGAYSHYHAGKNSLTIFSDGVPFIFDSGCCSYDDELFGFYKEADVHSSLLVNGQGDGARSGLYTWTSYAETDCKGWHDASVTSALTSSSPEWKDVSWTRTLQVAESVIVSDKISTNTLKDFTFILNLHPDVEVEESDEGIVLRNGDKSLEVQIASEIPFECDTETGKCFINGEHRDSTRLMFKLQSDEDFEIYFKLTRQ